MDLFERHILAMTRDLTPLLKFGKGGKPGFRAFYLEAVLMQLILEAQGMALFERFQARIVYIFP